MLRIKVQTPADWHVTLRGAKRLFLFRDDEDYRTFYGLMGDASKKTGVSMTSHCLMSNHLHLNPRADSEQLSEFMWRTAKGFADYHNRKYKMSGHVFDKPYYAGLITDPFVLKRVTRYINLNPVRGGKAIRPEDYPWSSCNLYFTGQPGPFFCDYGRVLQSFDLDPDLARLAYRSFVERDLLRKRSILPAANPAIEIWQEQFLWFLELAEGQGVKLAPMDVSVVASYWAAEIGVPPRAIAKARGLAHGGQVSKELSRFAKLLSERPDLKALVEAAREKG